MDGQQSRLAEAMRDLSLARQQLEAFEKDGSLHRVKENYRERMLTDNQDLRPSILPVIREDFADLSALTAEARRDEILALERIAVYVEDLDQCPPATIADAFQAISLLLSFPLFAVVIAANPLSILRAIGPAYLDRNTDTQISGDGSPIANPLQKVIQIPLWLQTMDRETSRRLVRLFAGTAVPVPSTPTEILALPQGVYEKPQNSNKQLPLDMFADPLTVTEITFAEEMVTFLATSPREAKRLILIYRLLRSMLTPAQRAELLGETGGAPEFPAVITNLTILAAAPGVAKHHFRALIDRSPKNLWESQSLPDST
jgi:hypothetical protein